MALKIVSNYHWRQFKYRNEVPAQVLADDFDYLNDKNGGDGFFYYRKNWYHIGEFLYIPAGDPRSEKWDGIHQETFFSGVVIKISDDGEEYQVGMFFS